MSVSQPGPLSPVPEPFWHRSWRTLWRWRPECIEHGKRFASRDEFDLHYRLRHLAAVQGEQETPRQ